MSGYTLPLPLDQGHNTNSFDCDESELNSWLKKYALTNQKSWASRCFVTCRSGSSQVVGFYALATGSVFREDASTRIGAGMPDPIPIVLLGRLAVDQREQGRGIGAGLLRDAIARTVEIAETIGVRALLVHALSHEARNFYLHFGFESSPVNDDHLMLIIKDARRLVHGSRLE